MTIEFSYRTRAKAIQRFEDEQFDLLIVGGGITGAAAARDAASRGLKVALIEKRDFACGTSSKSSKLIHGGLRYLENFEFALVFEALSERAFLLKTAPNRVRPLKFYFPVYEGDPNGMGKLSLGLWFYDLLALFRAPGFHHRLSQKKLSQEIPYLKSEGLKGGFTYFDASMWDDVLAIETLRSAHEMGSAIANYLEAKEPIWTDRKISGFKVIDHANKGKEFQIHAHRTVLCAGPWTDEIAKKCDPNWKPWLSPSKGVHLVFDLKKLPVPGALVMGHPEDGRISFVIPRVDLGEGVTIVGTTDGPAPIDPDQLSVEENEISYLMDLLGRYFPSLNLKTSDIISTYVGIRPLYAGTADAGSLQKVSREHHIGEGPGKTVIVAGGKYTTARNMAQEIIDFLLKNWKKDGIHFPKSLNASKTKKAINPACLQDQINLSKKEAEKNKLSISEKLYSLYGADALEVAQNHLSLDKFEQIESKGFPMLSGALSWSIDHEMVMQLDDFYLRRLPLYLSEADHGKKFFKPLKTIFEKRFQTTLDEESFFKALSRK